MSSPFVLLRASMGATKLSDFLTYYWHSLAVVATRLETRKANILFLSGTTDTERTEFTLHIISDEEMAKERENKSRDEPMTFRHIRDIFHPKQ